MRFAICNELFQDWPWERALELTLECGYTGWEIAPFTLGRRPEQLPADRRRQLADQIQRSGIEVVGLHWLLAKTEGYHLTTNESEVRTRTAGYLGQLSQLCRDLGGSVMVLGSPQQRNFPETMTHQQADENALSVLEAVLPDLEKNQVTLALEPLGPGEGNYWNHAAQTIRVIEQLDSPWVRLHLDVKAMSSEGKPIADVIRESAKHLVHFHANDPNLLGPGMGEVPFEPIFAALREVAYEGWVSVEVFDYSPGIETIARQSMQNMRNALLHLDV
ncbi:sugar phosphate isomerase/epimerase family protein [Aureliella helgolandensis]|uniref:D-tagatose 3-epimerase n=1 Tax=Aureliella helgolandensis TaxID=2527968 RepID=A0A518G402_9BACT|nr:sugar phosphate isomerase/epimerase family protein [Aureliella helgolandensis]QDV23322.1 D-tagatose 3-epimerase [Aureliella helgolandensis]